MAKVKTLVQMIRQGKDFRTKAALRAEKKKRQIDNSFAGQFVAAQDKRQKELTEAEKKKKRKKNTTLTGTRTSRDADAVLRKIKGK